jgi:predicted ATPase
MAPARVLAEQCLALAEEVDELDLLVEGHHALWVTDFFSGRLADALFHVEQGLALYRPEHRSHVFIYGQDPAVVAHSYGALIEWFMGRPAGAERHIEQALALGREVGHPFSLGFALNFVAWVHYCRGDITATRDYSQQLITLATDQGFPFWLAGATHFAAWAMVEDGEVETGLAQLRAGQEAWRATGAGLGLPSHLGRLVEAYVRAGQIEAAERTLAEAMTAMEKSGQRYYEAELNRLRGEILLTHANGTRRSDVPAEAEAALVRALAVATKQSSRWLALRAATSLGRLRQQQNRLPEARAILDRAVGDLGDDRAYPDAAAASALHAELHQRDAAKPRARRRS